MQLSRGRLGNKAGGPLVFARTADIADIIASFLSQGEQSRHHVSAFVCEICGLAEIGFEVI